MLNLVTSQSQMRQTSPLPSRPPAEAAQPAPADRVELAEGKSQDSSSSRWIMAAFSGLSLVAGVAGAAHAQQAQVVVNQQPQQVSDLMQQLDEASLKQGIDIEFMVPSPIGGGRRIAKEDAAELLSEGRRVLLSEVTRSDGPSRSELEPSLVRREAYLNGQSDLESYVRYFTQAEPQNDMERAAQKLKKYVYGQTELTVLHRPGQNPERPGLSPFAAARRLERQLPVTVRTEADGVIRTEPKEVTLNQLSEIDNVVAPQQMPCSTIMTFQLQPDGTIQLVEQPFCGN